MPGKDYIPIKNEVVSPSLTTATNNKVYCSVAQLAERENNLSNFCCYFTLA